MQQRSTACHREQQRPKADKASRRCLETDNGSSRVSRAKIGDAALAGSQRLGDGTHILFRHVAGARLERLLFLAVDLLCDYFRT